MTSFSINCLQQHHCDLEMVRDTTSKESLTTLMFLQQMCNWRAGWPNSTGNSLCAHTFTIRVKNIHISTHTQTTHHTLPPWYTHTYHTLTHHLHDPHIHTTHARTHTHTHIYTHIKTLNSTHTNIASIKRTCTIHEPAQWWADFMPTEILNCAHTNTTS